MKRFGQGMLALALAAGVSAAACAGDGQGKRDDAATGAAGTTGTAGTSADIDRKWVDDQLKDGDLEVRLGRLAQERASNAEVRAFAAMMVERHTIAGTDLKRVANRHNITEEPRKDSDNEPFEKLSKLSGVEFDRTYLEMMIEEHEDAVKAFEDKAGDKDEHADVKDWASKALPDVKQHLEQARNLRDRLNR